MKRLRQRQPNKTLRILGRFFLRRFWYVVPASVLLVELPAAEVFPQLEDAAKPSRERLYLQDVFGGGRRYRVERIKGGFSVLTTSKTYWRYTEGLFGIRRRTRSATRLIAQVEPIDEALTRLSVHQHFRVGYLLDILWIPVFFGSIIVAMPWIWWGTLSVLVILFGLSYLYHFYQAAYQANEMAFFLHRALKRHLVNHLPPLPSESPEVMTSNQSFASEWERFYQAHSDD